MGLVYRGGVTDPTPLRSQSPLRDRRGVGSVPPPPTGQVRTLPPNNGVHTPPLRDRSVPPLPTEGVRTPPIRDMSVPLKTLGSGVFSRFGKAFAESSACTDLRHLCPPYLGRSYHLGGVILLIESKITPPNIWGTNLKFLT